jgi:hypothetical protein
MTADKTRRQSWITTKQTVEHALSLLHKKMPTLPNPVADTFTAELAIAIRPRTKKRWGERVYKHLNNDGTLLGAGTPARRLRDALDTAWVGPGTFLTIAVKLDNGWQMDVGEFAMAYIDTTNTAQLVAANHLNAAAIRSKSVKYSAAPVFDTKGNLYIARLLMAPNQPQLEALAYGYQKFPPNRGGGLDSLGARTSGTGDGVHKESITESAAMEAVGTAEAGLILKGATVVIVEDDEEDYSIDFIIGDTGYQPQMSHILTARARAIDGLSNGSVTGGRRLDETDPAATPYHGGIGIYVKNNNTAAADDVAGDARLSYIDYFA